MRRVILFFLLLALGVGILVILAERQGDRLADQGGNDPGVNPIPLPLEAKGAQAFTKKLKIVQYRPVDELAENPVKIAESEIFAEQAFDQGNGYWKLLDVTIRNFQEKNPQATSFALQAKLGFMALSGNFGEMKVETDKPVQFEDVIADFYDARGGMPPLRIRAPRFEGILQEKRFWTDGPFTLEQPQGEDFRGSGEGLEGDAKLGNLVMKKNPEIRYAVRSAATGVVEREMRLRCQGPLTIERPTEPSSGTAPDSRLVRAQENATLEIQETKTGAMQTIRAQTLLAWMRAEKETSPSLASEKSKPKSPVAIEGFEAFGNVRIESEQAILFSERAKAGISPSGKLASLELHGAPRAAFSGTSASSMTQSDPGNRSAIFIQCTGPLEFSESETDEGLLRMRFETNVRLFGSAGMAYLPSRFGEQLELQIERVPAAPGVESTFRIVGAHADGNVSWLGADSAVYAPTMRMRRTSGGGMQVSFSPAPFLETRFASAALGANANSQNSARRLALFAENRLIQKTDPSGKGPGEITLEGNVLGRVSGGGAIPGRLESNGLRILSPRPGVTQIGSERKFLYEEGENGLRLQGDRVEPFGEQGIRFGGAPARLRQPSQKGAPLEITAASIGFDPISGEFRAQGSVFAVLPQDNGPPLQLFCQVLEGVRAADGQTLLRLEAFQDVKLNNQGQEAGGESMYFDFAEKVNRLFGTDEKPAWIAGPMDQGRFSAKSRRIEIRDEGNSIHLAPGALVEIQGKAVDFGAMTPKASPAKASPANGVRILPRGESHIEKDTIVFHGGVRLETSTSIANGGWTLSCKELTLRRDPVTGELRELEAHEDVEYNSLDMIATAVEMRFWPKENDILLLGDERVLATLRRPSEFNFSSNRIRYNLITHLVESGPGNATPTR